MSIRLLANVRRITGHTRHLRGSMENGEPVRDQALPPAAKLEILERDGLFFLIRYSREDEFAGDTAHETLAQARRQAQVEFEVDDADWCVIEPGKG